MTRALMLAAVLLLSVAWLQAQQDPQASPSNAGSGQGNASQTGSGSETTVQGCLQGSSGNFTLTDKSGTTYQLAGDTSKLTEHVGHEVKIKGTTSASSSAAGSSSTPASGAAAGGSQSTLTITEVKHVSKTCTPATK
jgi:hypothetical protein